MIHLRRPSSSQVPPHEMQRSIGMLKTNASLNADPHPEHHMAVPSPRLNDLRASLPDGLSYTARSVVPQGFWPGGERAPEALARRQKTDTPFGDRAAEGFDTPGGVG